MTAPRLKVGNVARVDDVTVNAQGDQEWRPRLRLDMAGSTFLDAEDLEAMAVMLAAPHVPGPFEQPLLTRAERLAIQERQEQAVREAAERRAQMARAREEELARLRQAFPTLAATVFPEG